jgi:hypothetical protein
MTAKSGLSNRKYQHTEYEDAQTDGLLRYFKLKDYTQLKWFLRGMKKEQ